MVAPELQGASNEAGNVPATLVSDVLGRIFACGVLTRVETGVFDAPGAFDELSRSGLDVVVVGWRRKRARELLCAATTAAQTLPGVDQLIGDQDGRDAVLCGARFLAGEGFSDEFLRECETTGVPVFENARIADDVLLTSRLLWLTSVADADVIVGRIRSLCPDARCVVAGPVTKDEVPRVLHDDAILACGADYFVAGPSEMLARRAHQAARDMNGFTFAHVGLNAAGSEEAERVASQFEDVFGFAKRSLPDSCFAGMGIEVVRRGGRGAHGHIGIVATHVGRAMAHLTRCGIALDHSSVQTRGQKETFVFLEKEISGFAVHVVQYD